MGKFNIPIEKPLSNDNKKLSSDINSLYKEFFKHANTKLLKPTNLKNPTKLPPETDKLKLERLKPEAKPVYPNQGDNQIHLKQSTFMLHMESSQFIMNWKENFQLINDKPSKLDTVAAEACLQAHMLSKITGKEWGGEIYTDKDDNYHYTLAVSNNADKSIETSEARNNIPFLSDEEKKTGSAAIDNLAVHKKIIASFHSHPHFIQACDLKVHVESENLKLFGKKQDFLNYSINPEIPDTKLGQIFSGTDLLRDEKDNHLGGDYMIDATGRVHKHIRPEEPKETDKTFNYLFSDVEMLVNKNKE